MLLNDFYSVQSLAHEGQTASATVELNKEHAIFSGHFPNNPVVPGVCLMTMVKETLERVIDRPLLLKEAKTVKFLGVVNPQSNLQLQISSSYTLLDDGAIKTNSTITAGDMVCCKINAVYVAIQNAVI